MGGFDQVAVQIEMFCRSGMRHLRAPHRPVAVPHRA